MRRCGCEAAHQGDSDGQRGDSAHAATDQTESGQRILPLWD
ncbi:hypothetical protein C791_4902 [Amycolatopsis azurea DSM 43854]|uniref:Uncharacterized protein n=1 Tax=Amycolatopsis azurea DSM 43854 TaxID=1238180 RepID=M2PLB3_9PSEU|nr:hypothetical protein C791_4902 [Amycolatopsis azurea DSM 43854]